ncbi:MAG: hypothetical protein ACK2T2_14065 [Anaerolineales bacterium]|jgi:predicted transcriptional regulator
MEAPLDELLNCINRAGRPLCATEAARTLDKPVDVVAGMLATLEGMGKLASLDQGESCRWCPLRSTCEGLSADECLYYNPATRSV